MGRRLPIFVRVTIALLLILAVPIAALAGLTVYQQQSVRRDIERKVEATLDLAINMEESLLRDSLITVADVAAAVASDPGAIALVQPNGPAFDVRRYVQAFTGVDMLLVVDRTGVVRVRATSNMTGDRVLLDGLVEKVMAEGRPQAHWGLIGPGELAYEGERIREQVDMPIFARETEGVRMDTALSLIGVAPVLAPGGAVVGAVIAADILNKDFRIVDEVARWSLDDTPINATIALDGVRVSTNVYLRDNEGNRTYRALGTQYSDAVMAALRAGKVYKGSARVVDHMHRAIYKPMVDYKGQVIAGAYVGIPETVFSGIGAELAYWSRLISAAGGGLLLLLAALVLWWLHRSLVVPVRHLSAVLKGGAAAEYAYHPANDEVGDLARALQERLRVHEAATARLSRLTDALAEARVSLTELASRSGAETDRIRSTTGTAVAAAAELQQGAVETLAHLTYLEDAVRAIGEGVRKEERSVHYVAMVTKEIAAGLNESQGHTETAVQDIARLTAAARAAIRQVGDFTAGLALLRQDLQASGLHSKALDLLRDPSDTLQQIAGMSERVAEQVRALVLIIQENQARLAFVEEEMVRVGGVVQDAAAQTQEAAGTAGQVISWLSSVTGQTVLAAGGVSVVTAHVEAMTRAAAELQAVCDELSREIAEVQGAK